MGATIHMHYCMNEFVGSSLWHNGENEKCGKCGMKEDAKKKGCCKDEHKQVKLKAEHQKAANAQQIQLVEIPALLIPIETYNFTATSIAVNFPTSNAPPKIPKERLYILHCVFLI